MSYFKYFDFKLQDPSILKYDLNNCKTNYENIHDFLCSICLSIVTNPVLCSICESLFCKDCMDLYLQSEENSNCVKCNSLFESIKIQKLTRNHLNSIVIKCPNEQCKVEKKYSNISDHVLLCEFTELDVFCKSCHTKVASNNSKLLDDHLNKCEEWLYTCECGYVCKSKFKHLHEDYCPLRTIKCKHCEEECSFKVRLVHKNQDCLNRILESEKPLDKKLLMDANNANEIEKFDIAPIIGSKTRERHFEGHLPTKIYFDEKDSLACYHYESTKYNAIYKGREFQAGCYGEVSVLKRNDGSCSFYVKNKKKVYKFNKDANEFQYMFGVHIGEYVFFMKMNNYDDCVIVTNNSSSIISRFFGGGGWGHSELPVSSEEDEIPNLLDDSSSIEDMNSDSICLESLIVGDGWGGRFIYKQLLKDHLFVIDLANRKKVKTLRKPKIKRFNKLYKFDLNNNKELLLVVYMNYVIPIDLATDNVYNKIDITTAEDIVHLKYSDTLAISTGNYIKILKASDFKELRVINCFSVSAMLPLINPFSNNVIAYVDDNIIFVEDVVSGEVIKQFNFDKKILTIAQHQNKRELWVVLEDGLVKRIS
jgi:hypothetical protein